MESLRIRKYKGGGRPKGGCNRVRPLQIMEIYEFNHGGQIIKIAKVTRALNLSLDNNKDECLNYLVLKCPNSEFCRDRAIEENIEDFVCTECTLYDKNHKIPFNEKIKHFSGQR